MTAKAAGIASCATGTNANAVGASVRLRYSMARKTRMEKFPIGPILEALGQSLPGGSRSGNSKAKCVFHDDQIASAVVDWKHNRFRCYACGTAGDGIELVMRLEGLTFALAVERCEAITGQAKPAVRGEPDAGRGLFDDAGYSD